MIDMYKWVLNLQRGLSDVSGQDPKPLPVLCCGSHLSADPSVTPILWCNFWGALRKNRSSYISLPVSSFSKAS